MSTRTLIVMRHAKSAYPGGTTDHQRPLNERGRTQAALAGDAIREQDAPDAVLCSDAARARETLAAAGLADDRGGVEYTVEYTTALYNAGVPDVLGVIAAVPDTVETLLVLGHAPGIPGAAIALTDPDDADPAAWQRLQSGMPTAAYAVLRVPTVWSGIADTRCRLVDLVIPR